MNYIFSTICSSIFVVKCLSKKKIEKIGHISVRITLSDDVPPAPRPLKMC